MNRIELINKFIEKRDYKSYLELGIYDGSTFDNINIDDKISVDLNFNAMYKMTTDKFFEINNKKFDIIFIDADHRSIQLIKDIKNSFGILNNNGVIVCHDCNPPTFNDQLDENNLYQTAWKAFSIMRFNTHYFSYCIDADCGLGVFDTSKKTRIPEKPSAEWFNYEYFDKNRKYMLGLISSKEFEKWMDD